MSELNTPARSKINWTQVVGIIAVFGTYFGIDMDAETQAAVATFISAGVMVATSVFRTFFTG